MSLKPVDLQNLFVNLQQIGREQSDRLEAPIHTQHVASDELKQKTIQSNERVNESENAGDGAEKIKDEENKGQNNSNASHQHSTDSGAEEDRNTAENLFQDPALGKNIDIVG